MSSLDRDGRADLGEFIRNYLVSNDPAKDDDKLQEVSSGEEND